MIQGDEIQDRDQGVPPPGSGHSDEPASGLAANAGSVPNADEWRYCGAECGGCSCMQVWSTVADAPVCKVESREWGDEYTAIRLVNDEGGTKAEAYTERVDYGFIPENIAKANAYLIAAAPKLLRACNTAFEFLGGMDDAAEVRDELLAAIMAAQAIEARSDKTVCGLGPKGESAVP